MKKALCTTVGLVALAAATQTHAAQNTTAKTGFYVGGNAGWSIASSPSSDTVKSAYSSIPGVTVSSVNQSSYNYAWGINVGFNYALDPHWTVGFEVGREAFGHEDYGISGAINNAPISASMHLDSDGIQGMFTGAYMAPCGVNIFAKVGGIYESTSFDNVSIAGVSVSDTTNKKLIPAAALGIGYTPIQNLDVVLQYEHTFGANYDDANTLLTTNKPMTQDVITLGVNYTLPM